MSFNRISEFIGEMYPKTQYHDSKDSMFSSLLNRLKTIYSNPVEQKDGFLDIEKPSNNDNPTYLMETNPGMHMDWASTFESDKNAARGAVNVKIGESLKDDIGISEIIGPSLFVSPDGKLFNVETIHSDFTKDYLGKNLSEALSSGWVRIHLASNYMAIQTDDLKFIDHPIIDAMASKVLGLIISVNDDTVFQDSTREFLDSDSSLYDFIKNNISVTSSECLDVFIKKSDIDTSINQKVTKKPVDDISKKPTTKPGGKSSNKPQYSSGTTGYALAALDYEININNPVDCLSITASLSDQTIQDTYNRFKKEDSTVDPDVVAQYLRRWDSFKDSKNLKKLEEYKNLQELEEEVKDLRTKKERELENLPTEDEKAEEVYSDGEWKALKTDNPKVLSQLAQGSNWCVRNIETAKGYLSSNGAFTIIFKNNYPFAAVAGEHGGVWYKTDSDFESETAYGIKDIHIFKEDYNKLKEILDSLGRPLKPKEGKVTEHEAVDGEAYVKKLIDNFKDKSPQHITQIFLTISGLRNSNDRIPEIEDKLVNTSSWIAYCMILIHKPLKNVTDMVVEESLNEINFEYLKTYGLVDKKLQNPTNEDLRWIIVYAPEEYKQKAAEQLLKQNPTSKELIEIIKYASKEYQQKAAEQLLKQNPTNEDLIEIIEYAPVEYKQKASEQLLKQNPTNEELIPIISYAPEESKQKAAEQLLKQNPTNEDLRWIINYAPEEYKQKAVEMLLKQNPTNIDLTWIIDIAPKEYKQKAWEQLLKQQPTNKDLIGIIVYAPEEYGQKAQKLLNERQSKNETNKSSCLSIGFHNSELNIFAGLKEKTPYLIKEYLQHIIGYEEAINRINSLKNADPTGDRAKYIPWIVSLDLDGTSRFPEDNERIRELLSAFDTLKNRNISIEKDIRKYKTEADLYNTIKEYLPERDKLNEYNTKKDDATIVLSEGEYTVYKPNTAEAVNELGKGTKWCTSGSSEWNMHSENYLKEGPIYIIYKNDKPYVQVHEATGQAKDRNDVPISQKETEELYNILKKIHINIPDDNVNDLRDYFILQIKNGDISMDIAVNKLAKLLLNDDSPWDTINIIKESGIGLDLFDWDKIFINRFEADSISDVYIFMEKLGIKFSDAPRFTEKLKKRFLAFFTTEFNSIKYYNVDLIDFGIKELIQEKIDEGYVLNAIIEWIPDLRKTNITIQDFEWKKGLQNKWGIWGEDTKKRLIENFLPRIGLSVSDIDGTKTQEKQYIESCLDIFNVNKIVDRIEADFLIISKEKDFNHELSVNIENIPEILKSKNNWVKWTEIETKSGKSTKLPISVITKSPADVYNPSTWASFDDVSDSKHIGFVISKDTGIVGIDLDNCIDNNGKIMDYAVDILDRLDSYSEISPSGKGIHIFIKASLTGSFVTDKMEVYGDLRYFSVTGNYIPEYGKEIKDRNIEINDLLNEQKILNTYNNKKAYYFGPEPSMNEDDFDKTKEEYKPPYSGNLKSARKCSNCGMEYYPHYFSEDRYLNRQIPADMLCWYCGMNIGETAGEGFIFAQPMSNTGIE